MPTLVKITAAACLTLFALSSEGNAVPEAGSAGGPAPAAFAAPAEAGQTALDQAGAALSDHGEVWDGRSAAGIRAEISALPRFSPDDGISPAEAAALDRLLQLGRQLSYAEAVEALRPAGAPGLTLADSLVVPRRAMACLGPVAC